MYYTYFEAMSSKGSLSSKDFVQMFLAILVILFSAILILKMFSKQRRKLIKCMEMFPGPRRFPLIGNVPQLFPIMKHPAKVMMKMLDDMCEKHGKVFRIWLFEDPKLMVHCPDTAIEILNNDLAPSKAIEIQRAAKILGGIGLISLDPDLHAQRRKMWYPSFNRKRIESATEIFVSEGIRLRQNFENYCALETEEPIIFDAYEPILASTFRIICAQAFGSEYVKSFSDSQGNEHNYCLHTAAENLVIKSFKPFLSNEFFYLNLTWKGRETKKCVKIGNSIVREAVKARKKLRALVAAQTLEGEDNQKSEISDCFMDQLLDFTDEGELTEEEVVYELNTFITAGYDTSGVTICSMLYYLSLHPKYQEKIVQELYEIIGYENITTSTSSDYAFTFADTKNMKFMELCIKETLRLVPAIPILPRRTFNDVELSDGRVIPAGVDVGINILKIQRDPKFFPEPEKFLPERHLTPNSAWMPFSLGSRNCIGQVFAMQEMKILLAYLLLAYKFEAVDGESPRFLYKVILVSENGLRCKITKRHRP